MIYLLLSTTGFLFLIISDILQIYQKKFLIIILSFIGYMSVFTVTLLLIIDQTIHPAGSAATILKIILAVLSFGGLVYVLFAEVPLSPQFKETEKREVYSRGTYGIVRHPGFFPFVLLFAALNSLYMSRSFLLISIYLILLDFLLILIEDIIVFPRIFSNYKSYKQTVPFLIPGLKR